MRTLGNDPMVPATLYPNKGVKKEVWPRMIRAVAKTILARAKKKAGKKVAQRRKSKKRAGQ